MTTEAAGSPVVPAPKLNFWQQLEAAFLRWEHPEAKAALSAIATAIAADKTALVAAAATSGMSAGAFLEAKVQTLINSSPAVGPFAGFIMSFFSPFLAQEIGYGVTDVGIAIDKIVAFLTLEEQYV
jgi:hypothetical protein